MTADFTVHEFDLMNLLHSAKLAVAGHPDDELALLAQLLPPTVVLRQCPRPADEGFASELLSRLHPLEACALARAVPARAHEFALGRHCARQALATLCGFTGAVPAHADRSPQWPASVVGSITHDDLVAAAAVALRSDLCAIGIDSDLIDRFDDALAPMICGAAELAHAQALPAAARRTQWALVFCIKEAIYKAQYPLTSAWLDFADLQVDLTAVGPAPWQGCWRAVLQRAVGGWPVGHSFSGPCAVNRRRAAAALLLPAASPLPTS